MCRPRSSTSVGQLIASSEYLLCLVKPQLAARIGRLLLRKPRDCRVNCRYGPHERHTLDVYGVHEQQQQQAPAKPVLVFMHGGAWSFGHKWQYALVGSTWPRRASWWRSSTTGRSPAARSWT